MDKKSFAQFLLASAFVLIVWWLASYFLVRSQPEARRPGEPAAVVPEPAAPPPAARQRPPEVPGGERPPPAVVREQEVQPVEGLVLANEHIHSEWTNVGAGLQRLELLDVQYRAPYEVDGVRPVLTLLNSFQGVLGQPRAYPVVAQPRFVAAGDFDGDGRPDLAVTSWAEDVVAVLRGSATGRYEGPYAYPVCHSPYGISAADLNADGLTDLVVANAAEKGTVSVLLSAAGAMLSVRQDYAVGSAPSGVVAADFDADGRTDIAVANQGEQTVTVLRNGAGGQFTDAAQYAAGESPADLAVADFNNDGLPDLAVANAAAAGTVTVLLGSGNGQFAPGRSYSVGRRPWSLEAADLNGDALTDLAVITGEDGYLRVIFGLGDGTFGGATSFPVGRSAQDIAAADFDGDGHVDLAVTVSGAGVVRLLLNRAGDGAQFSWFDYQLEGTLWGLAAGDADGDGWPDLLVADAQNGALNVLSGYRKGYISDTIDSIVIMGRGDPEDPWKVRIPASNLPYRVVEQTPERLVFEARLRYRGEFALVLRKTVSVGPGYDLQAEVELINESAETVAVGFDLRGAAGIERETLKTAYLGTRVGIAKGPGDYSRPVKRAAQKLEATDEEPNESGGIAWAGVANHYFAALTLFEDPEAVAAVESLAVTEQELVHARGVRWDTPPVRRTKLQDRRKAAANATVLIHVEPIELEPGAVGQRYYKLIAAPKKLDVLKTYDAGLDQLVEFGMIPSLSRMILALLNMLQSVIPNYGVAVILLTVIVRLGLHPLTRKSQMSMARMQKLQPEITELQKKYAGDKEQITREQMKLWRKYGVSPLGGCGPMLLQMPVFFALFGALRAAIELRHAGFLWVSDLSAPDTLFFLPVTLPILLNRFNLLPVIMAVMMAYQQKSMPQAATEQARQQQKMMKWFPIFLAVLLYNLPSGLCLYITCSTGIGLLERWFIMKEAEKIELKPVDTQRRDKAREKGRPQQPARPRKKGWFQKLQDIAEGQNQLRSKKNKK